MEHLKDTILIIGLIGTILAAVHNYLKSKKELQNNKELEKKYSKIVDDQNNLLKEFMKGMTLILQEHSGMNDNMKKDFKQLEQHFDMKLKLVDNELQAIKNNMRDIDKDIKQIYTKLI